MKKKIYYLHGLGSGPKANTAVGLAQHFEVSALAYTPHDFETALPVLLATIPEGTTVVGTSMGGYFALKIAERINKLNVIAINPVIPAREGLARFKETGFEDFVTGTLRPVGNLAAFEDLSPSNYALRQATVQIVAGALDDVVPPTMVAAFAEQHGLPFTLLPQMGHRVEQSLGDIFDLINESMEK